MANTKLLDGIISYGIQNKKKKDEIMRALLKTGQVDVGTAANAIKALDDMKMFSYETENTQPEKDPKQKYEEALKFALDNRNSDDINMKTRANKFLLDVESKKILPNGYRVENDEVAAILANPQIYNDLTPSIKSELIPELSKAGFKFPKKLSGEQEKARNNAETGISALNDMNREVFDEQGELRRGNLVQEALPGAFGAKNLRTQANLVKEAISRMQSGAALTDTELKFYRDLIPGPTDSTASAKYKMDQLNIFFAGLSGAEIKLKNDEGKIIKYDDMFDPRQRGEVRKMMSAGFKVYQGTEFDQVYGETIVEGDPAYKESDKKEDPGIMGAVGQVRPESFKGVVGDGKQEQKAEERPLVKKIGDFLGITKFGEGIGTALFLKTKEGRDLQKKAEEGDEESIKALQQILEDAPNAKELIGSAAMTALNVASAGMASRATLPGKVVQGAATGYGFDVASNLQDEEKTVEEAVKPGAGTAVGGVIPIVGAVKNAFARGGQKVAERVMNSVVKPSIDDLEKSILYNGKTLGKEMLDEGIKGTKRTIFKKAIARLAENEDKLQKVLDGSTAIIKKEELLPYLSKLKEKLIKTPTQRAQKALQTIDDAVNLFPDRFNLSQANELKRNLYSELNDLAYKLDPNLSPTAETSKALAGGLKDLIEKKASSPDVAAINKKLSTFMKVQDGMLDQIARTQRNNLAGVGTVGAIIEKMLGATAIKTYGSVVVNKAAKIIEKSGSETGGKITKLMVLNAIEKAKRDSKRR